MRTFAFFILVLSGLDSHVLQYMRKVHTHGVNIRYISEVQFKLSRNERILNKANAYLCMLFFAFCYLIGGNLLFVLWFYACANSRSGNYSGASLEVRSVALLHAYSDLTSRRGREFISCSRILIIVHRRDIRH